MSDSPDIDNTPEIHSDTFWELIEKLLLKKTRDDQSRQRHNAALSALCRGHALSRLPRDQKPKAPNKIVLKPKENSQTNKSNPTNQLKTGSEKKSSGEFEISVKVDKRGKVPENIQNENQRSKSENIGTKTENAKEARSECRVNDHDIVYLKDSAVPASERLWRYAIKNRKKAADGLWEKANEAKPIPSIRSNEAIYLGLRKRMEGREKERRLIREDQEKRSTITRQHSCSHLRKIRNDMLINKASNARVRRTQGCQFQKQKQPSLSRKLIQPSISVPTMPQGMPEDVATIKPAFRRDEMLSPWTTKDAWSNLTKMATAKCKERFESKRQLYNSVIKRRLNCGNQLETYNKQLVDKKNSGSRTILSKETQRRYSELKSEYLNLCYQESTLRHQIALLHAEIYMMQNKGYHKTLATVKTITLDSQSTPLHRSHTHSTGHMPDFNAPQPMLFPSLKAPRPLISLQQRAHTDRPPIDKPEKSCLAGKSKRTTEVHDADAIYLPNISDSSSSTQGVCSIYSISPQIMTKPREPFTLPEKKEDKLVHRLPKMAVNVGAYNVNC